MSKGFFSSFLERLTPAVRADAEEEEEAELVDPQKKLRVGFLYCIT